MARRLTLKEAFLKNEDEKESGKLSTKQFGKSGEYFPKDKEKVRMSDDDIKKSISSLEKESKDKEEKSTFKLGKLDPDLQKDVPLEKQKDDPKVKQVDKELGGFKSLLEDEENEKELEKEKPETPFDDAFEEYQDKQEKEEQLKDLDEPFSEAIDECGCPMNSTMGPEPVDPATNGLSADVLSDEEDEYGPTEFVVIKIDDADDRGLNVRTNDRIEYGAPENRHLTENKKIVAKRKKLEKQAAIDKFEKAQKTGNVFAIQKAKQEYEEINKRNK